ncbi:hypothetical protein AB4Y64_17560 [Lysobacter sp. TAF61]|uniref:hypothetical protein n=1 Tax=Lysobacter sp. TAF61 TaxID=3233072 RepID=UPI003F99BF2D
MGGYKLFWRKTLFRAVLIYVVGAITLLGSEQVFVLANLPQGPAYVAEIASLFIARTALYFAIARRDATFGLKQLALIVASIEIFDCITVLALGAPLAYLQEHWWYSPLHLLAAITGLGAAQLRANNSFKPKPLRGSA